MPQQRVQKSKPQTPRAAANGAANSNGRPLGQQPAADPHGDAGTSRALSTMTQVVERLVEKVVKVEKVAKLEAAQSAPPAQDRGARPRDWLGVGGQRGKLFQVRPRTTAGGEAFSAKAECTEQAQGASAKSVPHRLAARSRHTNPDVPPHMPSMVLSNGSRPSGQYMGRYRRISKKV